MFGKHGPHSTGLHSGDAGAGASVNAKGAAGAADSTSSAPFGMPGSSSEEVIYSISSVYRSGRVQTPPLKLQMPMCGGEGGPRLGGGASVGGGGPPCGVVLLDAPPCWTPCGGHSSDLSANAVSASSNRGTLKLRMLRCWLSGPRGFHKQPMVSIASASYVQHRWCSESID